MHQWKDCPNYFIMAVSCNLRFGFFDDSKTQLFSLTTDFDMFIFEWNYYYNISTIRRVSNKCWLHVVLKQSNQKTEPKYKFLNPLKDSPISGLYYPSWIWTRPVSHAITWVISMQQVISNWYVNDIKVAQTGHFKTVQNMHFAFTLDNIFEYFLYSWIIYICNYFRLFILCFWSSDHCLLQLLRIVSNSAERLKILNASQSEKTFQSWSCCMLFTST